MNNDALVLVTGGTGFLGATLLHLLAKQNIRIRAIRRKSSPMDLVAHLQNIEWVEADITDIVALEEAFQGVTHVYHCAAMVSFHPRDIRQMMNINVQGTANVVNLALDFNIQKFVHVSSIAALGRSKERYELDEQTKWVNSSANTNYAISKYQSEQEVWRAHHEGLPIAIVNPAVILGAGFWDEGSAKFFRQLDDGLKFWTVGTSGFVDVRDVARFMFLLMESKINGERYVLAAENMPYRALFEKIALALGKKPPSIKVTPFLAEVAWRVEWLKEKLLGATPVVTKESARASVSKYKYLNQKSLGVSNFVYHPVDQTIQETASLFKQAKANNYQPKLLNL
jgi:dihydroflavonol-4-reductase